MSGSTTEPSVLYEVDAEGVAVLTLNRPEKRNAFDASMLDEWQAKLQQFADDAATRVLVITGAGKAFCSGGDLQSMVERDSQNALERKDYLFRHVHKIQLAVSRLDKPVIAAINGPARGAGVDMALMSDIRLMAKSATLSANYVDLGLIAGNGGAYMLPRLIGVERALEMLWTCRVIDAAEAVLSGLVWKAVPDADLIQQTMGLARRIAAQPTDAVRMLKRTVYQSLDLPLATHLDMVSSHMSILRDSDEHRLRASAAARGMKK